MKAHLVHAMLDGEARRQRRRRRDCCLPESFMHGKGAVLAANRLQVAESSDTRCERVPRVPGRLHNLGIFQVDQVRRTRKVWQVPSISRAVLRVAHCLR